jgi:hypothetical protein
VRHAGYTSLQAELWQRSTDRAAARSEAAAAAELSRGLMSHLEEVRGKLAPAWSPGELGSFAIRRAVLPPSTFIFQ